MSTTKSTARLCAGLIFEVSSKTEDEAVNNEKALMQVYQKYKEVNPEKWNTLRVNLISLTHDDEHQQANADVDAQGNGEPAAAPFHKLYVFYPADFEVPCDAADLGGSSPDHISVRWVELSKQLITDDMKKTGVETLAEIWNLFRTHLGLDEQKTMPLNVIGISENSSQETITPSSASSSSSSACGSGSCDAKPNDGGGAESNGEKQTCGGGNDEI